MIGGFHPEEAATIENALRAMVMDVESVMGVDLEGLADRFMRLRVEGGGSFSRREFCVALAVLRWYEKEDVQEDFTESKRRTFQLCISRLEAYLEHYTRGASGLN